MIDFSKLSAKDVPKLVPFPGLTVSSSSSASSSGSSSSSSSSSSLGGTKGIMVTAADGEDQRSPYLMVTEGDDKDLQVHRATVDTNSSEDDEQVCI